MFSVECALCTQSRTILLHNGATQNWLFVAILAGLYDKCICWIKRKEEKRKDRKQTRGNKEERKKAAVE